MAANPNTNSGIGGASSTSAPQLYEAEDYPYGKVYKCVLCGRRYWVLGAVKNHIRERHAGDLDV